MMKNEFHSLRELRLALPMSDWKPQYHKRKRHFKWLLILLKTPSASRLSPYMQMSQKSLCSSSGILSRRTILDICPRVEGVNFIDVPDDDTTLAFLIKLGYKDPLYKHTNMFVDHMHQPWRTLGMFYRENVDYPELIWEDFSYQIDHMKEKRSSRENMPFPRFTKVIINYFLKQHNSLLNLKYQHYYTIKADGIVCRLKFVIIGKDYLEYGLSIPETMLRESIKQSESYQMFIKYSTGHILPKKSRGQGSERKKTVDDSQETVDVSEESKPEPEPVKRKTSSKRRVKKKVTLSADDNIISDDPDTALELGKSISKTEAEETEAARQVHATHARIVTESVPKPTKRRKSGKVTYDPPKKLKVVPSLTLEEQEAADIMQDLKESKQTSKRQPGTGGSRKGTGTIPGVLDESTVVSATSSEGTGTKPGVPDEEKDKTKENVILEWGSEQESEYSEEDKLDNEEKDDKEGDDETESDEDDIYKYMIRVRKDEDEEMLNAEVEDSDKGDEEVTDAAKADAEKTSEVKDDAKKTGLPPTSSSLSVSLGFGDQFLKLSSDSSLVSIVKDTTDAEINSLLEVKIQSKVPHNQSPSMLSVPMSVISEPSILTPLRVSKLEKDVFELKKIDISAESLAALKTQVPSIVYNYLASKVGDVFQKELKKHTEDLIQKYFLQQIRKLPKKQIPTVDLEQKSEKTPSDILKIKKEQVEKQKMPNLSIEILLIIDCTNALMEALIEDENAMDKGVADTVQNHKRKHDDDEGDDDEDPLAGPNQGSKTSKFSLAKEPVEEPIAKVVMDDVGDDVVHDYDQPQDTSEPKTTKTLNPYWFTQPPRPPTPDPEWNKRQVVLDQPKQPWFNQMVSATKDPLTFDDLMATSINISKYVLNRLKIDNLT
ncbi:hypothetical protein Tco_0665650 [Tanacetum coccineum]